MEEKNLDVISRLPFEIKQRIISCLPLEEAVRASALSTVWRSLWSPIEVSLNFDPNPTSHEGPDDQDLSQVLGMCMSSFACPEQWKLILNVVDSSEEAKFIVKATKGVHRHLHLEFFETEKTEPIATTSSNCLRLRENLAKTDGFSGVKILHLRSVTNLTKNLVSDLFSNCHVLESLKIEKCRGLQGLDVETESLRSLVMADCSHMADVSVSAPNLELFSFSGFLPRIMSLKNTMSLVDVVLNFRDGPAGSNEFDCDEILSTLFSVKDVETLTVSGWLLEWLCSAGVIFGRLEFQFNKLRALTWIDSLMNKDKRDSLACFLNSCPLLEKLLVEVDSKLSTIPCPYFHHYRHEPHLWMDFIAVKFNTAYLSHLKSVELLGFAGGEEEVLLMDLLLEKAISLNSLALTSSPQDSN